MLNIDAGGTGGELDLYSFLHFVGRAERGTKEISYHSVEVRSSQNGRPASSAPNARDFGR